MKERLDVLLFEKNLVPSREQAKIAVMEGRVYVDGQKEDKPGTMVKDDAVLEVRDAGSRYVSRGGLKLEKAMEYWPITLKGRITADIGASTGGFTDCMLQNGAERVYAVDVGYGQLAWSLRNDQRVVNLEKTNARYLSRDVIPEQIDFLSIDVSFISLTKILPAVQTVLRPDGEIVALIKPQFEAGREKVGKNGVVRSKETHAEVVDRIVRFSVSIGFTPLGLTFSPIKGPKGNIEYLLYLRNRALKEEEAEEAVSSLAVRTLVETSHELL